MVTTHISHSPNYSRNRSVANSDGWNVDPRFPPIRRFFYASMFRSKVNIKLLLTVPVQEVVIPCLTPSEAFSRAPLVPLVTLLRKAFATYIRCSFIHSFHVYYPAPILCQALSEDLGEQQRIKQKF